MKTINPVQRDSTPLYQQLLVLIPMIKALEDRREAEASPMPPLLVEIERHKCGSLTFELSDAPANNSGRRPAELTLAIYNGSRSRMPLTYQDAYIAAWSYLSRSTPMNSTEYEAMYKAFFLSWYVHLFEYEDNIKTLGLA
ncbi:hypothetical protein [Rugamonas sp.]|uniref:hypothetical protein n=1 Tax=Rugamonas sp. TaxID=1926287 RepID=UPI0025E4BC36|nr:hypothetical protein [Rugamonas sp.]